MYSKSKVDEFTITIYTSLPFRVKGKHGGSISTNHNDPNKPQKVTRRLA
jgi:hypothetical protein